MQLLRDNLTLWTSSDTADSEAQAAAGSTEAPKGEADKPAEKEAEGKADEPAPES